MAATSRMFAALLFSLFVLVGISLAGSWDLELAKPVASASHPTQTKADPVRGEQPAQPSRIRVIGKWMTVAQGLALIVCAGLYGVALRLRTKTARDAREKLAAELALERRVEERTRELRQEVEDRRRVEHLNRGQKQILEMLAAPGDLKTEDILRYLAEIVASRNQGWECAIHLVERRGKSIHLAACSEVTDRLKGYLEDVGTEYPDTPECQACASGETHVVEHLSDLGLAWSELLAGTGIFSAWAIPFCANGSSRLAGTLTVYSRGHCKPGPSMACRTIPLPGSCGRREIAPWTWFAGKKFFATKSRKSSA